MQGNCSAKPPDLPGPALLLLKPGQCVLTSTTRAFLASAPGHHLVLRSLYFRAVPAVPGNVASNTTDFMMLWLEGGAVWLESVTFHGDRWKGDGWGKGGRWTGLVNTWRSATRIHLEGVL
jgi:hypothetical protein